MTISRRSGLPLALMNNGINSILVRCRNLLTIGCSFWTVVSQPCSGSENVAFSIPEPSNQLNAPLTTTKFNPSRETLGIARLHPTDLS